MTLLRNERRISRRIIVFAVAAYLATGPIPVAATTLSFPDNRVVGAVQVRAIRPDGWDLMRVYQDWHFFRPARGKVVVPEGHEVWLEVPASAAIDLSFCASFPPDAIQRLAIKFSRLDVAQLRAISRLRSLRCLEFIQCDIADQDLHELGVLPRLAYVDLSLRDKKDPKSLVRGIQWLASLPELYSVSLGGWGMPDATIESLANCRNLEVLSLGIPDLKDQHLRALAYVPRLRWLDLHAQTTRSIGASFALMGKSHSLESLRIWGVPVDAAMVRGLSEVATLRKLAFFNAQMSEDAVPEIQFLKQIHELNLPRSARTDPHKLAEVLSALPELRVWPTLRLVDDHTLDLIARAPRVESLQLESLPRLTISPEHFAKLGRLIDLREIRLSYFSIGDQNLASLAGLKNLETMTFWNCGISGDGLRSLKDLPKLTRVGVVVPEGIRPHLEALTELPHVTDILAGGMDLRPPDFEPFSRMHKLTRLQIILGLTDDTTVAHLSSLKDLEMLSLDESVLTDTGLRALMGMKRLSQLSVGGVFSDKEILQLAALPHLVSLTVASNNVTEAGIQKLKSRSTSLQNALRHPLQLAGTDVMIDANGTWRNGDAEAILRLAPLEGHAPPPLTMEHWYKTGGQRLALNDLRGKVVLLDFWGVWCGACIAEFSSFRRIREKYGDQGFEIVGIHTTDDGKRMLEFARERHLNWPIGVDILDKTKAAYRVTIFPSLYLVDRRGILRVAQPHPYQLEEQIRRLLSEPAPN